MNCVSGKVNVCTRPGWLVSSVPSSFTSTTCRRGWYLCKDCKTTICPAERKGSAGRHVSAVSVRWAGAAGRAGAGWSPPPRLTDRGTRRAGDWLAGARPALVPPGARITGAPEENRTRLPGRQGLPIRLALLLGGTKIFTTPDPVGFLFEINQSSICTVLGKVGHSGIGRGARTTL